MTSYFSFKIKDESSHDHTGYWLHYEEPFYNKTMEVLFSVNYMLKFIKQLPNDFLLFL